MGTYSMRDNPFKSGNILAIFVIVRMDEYLGLDSCPESVSVNIGPGLGISTVLIGEEFQD